MGASVRGVCVSCTCMFGGLITLSSFNFQGKIRVCGLSCLYACEHTLCMHTFNDLWNLEAQENYRPGISIQLIFDTWGYLFCLGLYPEILGLCTATLNFSKAVLYNRFQSSRSVCVCVCVSVSVWFPALAVSAYIRPIRAGRRLIYT